MARVRSWWTKSSGRVRVSVLAFLVLLCMAGLFAALDPSGVLPKSEANVVTYYYLDIEVAPEPAAGDVYALWTTYGGGTPYPPDTLAENGYQDGETVTIEARPSDGNWVFDHWEGDLTGSANPTDITMDADKFVTAAFFANLLPTPQFEATPLSGNVPLTVQFTDTSLPGSSDGTQAGTGTISSWEWDFDNDSTIDSSAQHPAHEYTAPGVYSVSLTVTNENGSATLTQVDLISVAGPPEAEFSAAPTSGDEPLQVTFTDLSIDNLSPITAWAWDFDNDSTIDSTDQHPTHTYSEDGVYTVSLTVTNALGNDTETKTGYVTVNNVEPPTASFTANPTSGLAPLTVGFTDTSDPGTGTISAWSWDFNNDGSPDSTQQHPTAQYMNPGLYSVKLEVTSEVGSDDETVTDMVHVMSPAVPDFSADVTQGVPPLTVNFTDLSDPGSEPITAWAWDFDNDTVVDSTAQHPEHVYTGSGVYTVSLGVTTAAGTFTETKQDFIVTNAPAGTFAATPNSINHGETVTLTWTSLNATSAVITPDVGEVALNGSTDVSPDNDTTYTLWLANAENDTQYTASVDVVSTANPQPEGTFGEKYDDLIPPDATLEDYDPDRFSVITGHVFEYDVNGDPQPLAGVSVTAFREGEYGTATSDATGRFSLPVEGGALFTVRYGKTGYISADRAIETRWNDILVVEDVVLIPADTKTTQITLDGNPASTFLHESTLIDGSAEGIGDRSATLVFAGDTKVYETDGRGNVLREITDETLTVRVTEYPTPESMPAALPPTTAFTYCAEFGIDGIDYVEFDKPVAAYLDNFLGFPVGTIVPYGYYDRESARWKTEQNGRVVQLLDNNPTDGIVDGLDADGDGAADDLDGDLSTTDEVAGITGDNVRYPVGGVFWRVEMSHFTPNDLNWAALVEGTMFQGVTPTQEGATPSKTPTDCSLCPKESLASIIDARERTMSEDFPVAGTGLALHYTSKRSGAYRHIIQVPVRTVPDPGTLARVTARVHVAGRVFEQTFEPTGDEYAEFVWDGLDFRGNVVDYPVQAEVRVIHAHDAQMFVPDSGLVRARAFGEQYPVSVSFVASRVEIELRGRDFSTIEVPGQTDAVVDGWSISNHHRRIPMVGAGTDTGSIVFGDGGSQDAGLNDRLLFEGPGNTDWIVPTPDGSIYLYQDSPSSHIRLDPDGTVTVLNWGQGAIPPDEWPPEGLPATEAQFGTNGGVDAALNPLDPDAIYLSTNEDQVVRIGLKSGWLTVVAGVPHTPGEVPGGDGGPAKDAVFHSINYIQFDYSGNLYLAHRGHDLIRRVDTEGIVDKYIGGFSGGLDEGDHIFTSGITSPGKLVFAPDGNGYVKEGTSQIWRIDTAGFASLAHEGPSTPGLARADDAALYFWRQFEVYKRWPDGTITTLAGTGLNPPASGVGPDDVTILSHADVRAHAVALGPNDEVYVSLNLNDSDTHSYLYQIAAMDDPVSPYVFDPVTGLHLSTRDPVTGVTLTTFGYDANDKLVSITDRFGESVSIVRDGSGRIDYIEAPNGEITDLQYDASDRIVRIAYADPLPGDGENESGVWFDLAYTSPNGANLMTSKTEPNGNTFTYAYDEHGRVTSVSDERGATFGYADEYVEGSMVYTRTSAEGLPTVYTDTRNEDGTVTTDVTTPSGAVTTATVDADGMRTEVALSCGGVIERFFEVDPEFLTRTMSKSVFALPSAKSVTTGFAREYIDDDADEEFDRIVSTVAVDLNLDDVLDASDPTATAELDLVNARLTLSSPLGRSVEAEYDPATLLTSRAHAPGFYDTKYVYDAKGRVTHVQVVDQSNADALVRQAITTYYEAPDARAGRVEKSGVDTDLDGSLDRFAAYDYDALGRVTQVTGPDANAVQFWYDANGNMTVLTTPHAVEHDFAYNEVDGPESYVTPLSGAYTYTYDLDRRPKKVIFPSAQDDPDGVPAWDNRIIENFYHGAGAAHAGLLDSVSTPEGDIEFFYGTNPLNCGDQLDLITKFDAVSQGTETVALTYDGPVVTEVALSGTVDEAIGFGYRDGDLALESVTYAGATETIGYDADGLVTLVGAWEIYRTYLGQPNETGLAEWISDGNLTITPEYHAPGKSLMDGAVYGVDYEVGGSSVMAWDVSRNDLGQIDAKTETVDGASVNYVYTYTVAGQLDTVTKDSVLVEDYAYDAQGRRTGDIDGRVYSYDDEDHLTSVADGVATTWYDYDVDGFLTAKEVDLDGDLVVDETTVYEYGARGELISVVLPDGTVIEYVNGPSGQRIAKLIDGVVVEKYLWGGLTNLLAVLDASGNVVQRFEYAGGQLPVAVTTAGGTFYLHYDQVGSLRAITDSAGNVVREIAYDSFGNVASSIGTGPEIPMAFAGGLYDADTGLTRFGFRDYDAEVGRWTAKDPIGFSGGDTDLYAYCGGDPIGYRDLSGLDRLEFDGETLTWIFEETRYFEDGGFLVGYQEEIGRCEFSANSGKVEDGQSVYERIPEGRYFIDPAIDKEIKLPLQDWGPFAYRLHEDILTGLRREFLTERTGGFFIHGGWDYGTAGCIEFRDWRPPDGYSQDIAARQPQLHDFDRLIQNYGRRIWLTVRYD